MNKIFSLNKKILFAVLSILSVVGYGYFVFAAAPNGGYAPGSTLDPACAPGDTDCVVSIGGLNPNSILYTNANGNITTDSSFTRNATNHDTYIGRTYQNTLPGDLTLTLDPLIAEFSPDPTPAAFVPGEQLTFEDTNTNTTYTGVYSGFANTINQPEINANTTFNGSGINDLNVSANSGYSGPVPTTFTVTIVEKDLPIYGPPYRYNGTFQIGETVIGSNSGATGVVVSTVHGLVLDNITGTFQQFENITGNSSGATINNDVNGNPVDVFSYDNGDVSGIGIAGYDSIQIDGNSLYFNMSNSTGHEIGDQWIIDVTSTPFYIHIHKVSNINSSVQEEQLSITGQTSNVSIQAGLYAVTPLGAPGDQIIFSNYSGPTPIIDGIGAITAVNGNNYGIQIQQGTYHVGDLAFINNQNGDDPLALVSTANTDPITVDMSSGFSINSNILGAGLRGSVFQQTDGTITGVMGALDASSVGGRSVTLGSNISSTATNATSFTSQTIDEIIQTVEMNSGDKSVLSLTGSQFKLSTTYTSNPNPALESGFMSTFNQSTTLVPAWFVGSNVQKLPSDLGSSGYVLTTDGAGNLSWAASSGGSSPISINGSTLYSSGLANTGSYSNNNIFLGDSAGYNATGLGNSNFFGPNAGFGATNASNSNFLGQSAGHGAPGAYNSNFFGPYAGFGATNASNSNFLGNGAGYGATGASNSNFLGYNAGINATSAYNSNFFGQSAGNGATGASNSNFFGPSAGYGATGAYYSNFLGQSAGYNATSASGSNFLGYSAGNGAVNANDSNFLGRSAGNGATGASNSNFFGFNAGSSATNASYSNFLGLNAGYGATGASNSNFLGNNAGNGATSASYSNFFGSSAGNGATGASYSNFLGQGAGSGATGASRSNFFGPNAGSGATGASYSNFLGNSAGYGATNASISNFLGHYAGYGATNASRSNFLGQNAGQNATIANHSNFLGFYAGYGATNASFSNFIGANAGEGAASASNSIFIGKSAGYNDLVNNTGSLNDFSILIGPNTSTGNNGSGVGYSNSIALGGSATNTASNQFMIGSSTRPINTLVLTGASGNTCTLDVTVASPSCSSDERLKTNVQDLTTDTLDKVLNIKTVSYTWNNFPDKGTQIGFLAQDLEQYFPSLVSDAPNGFKTVSYGGMTPVLVQAIREMNLKITTINDMTTPNTWRDSLIAWFGNVENGIIKFFAGEIETKKLCIADDAGDKTCITKAQLDQLLMNTVNNSVIVTSPSPDPAPQDSPSDNSVDPSTDITEPTPDAEDTTVPTPDTSSDSVPSDTESVPDTSESSTATE